MRIAITGGAGFVGRATVRHLQEHGAETRILVRGSLDRHVDALQGDVNDPAALAALLDGCEAVVHLAPGFRSGEAALETVVSGTRAVCGASRDAGVQRLIYLSCLGVDAAATDPFWTSQWRAETIVRQSGVSWTILRSSTILGRGDCVTVPLAALIRSLPAVPVPGDGTARFQPIDVADVARCVAGALQDEKLTGETVSIGGPVFLTFRQLVDLVGDTVGLRRPKILLPVPVAQMAGRRMPAIARSLYAPPRLTQWTVSAVASPGIVHRWFGFHAASVVPLLASYAQS